MFCLKKKTEPAAVVHTFNPSTRKAEAGGSLELEASLVYRAARAVNTEKPSLEKTKKRE